MNSATARPVKAILSEMTSKSPEDVSLVTRAYDFAEEAHRPQKRYSGDPYFVHTAEVGFYLAQVGMDAAAIAAGLLHDTIEDTETTENELTTTFGSHVSSVVLEVTDDKSLEKHVRKQRQIEHAPHISTEAKLVKLADKICNLRDILASPPANWSTERKQAYFDWASKVVAGLRGVHPNLEAVFDGLVARHAELR